MIYDCFTFFNELDVLEIRLHEMAPVVDKFVLVEATQTFQGLPKPLYFADHRGRFATFSDRIIHVVVDFPVEIRLPYKRKSPVWQREFFQRDAIARGLSGALPDDLVIISDVDEVISARSLRVALAGRRRGDLTVFSMPHFQTFLDRTSLDILFWYGPKMIAKRYFATAETLRSLRPKHRPKGISNNLSGRLRARAWNAAHRGFWNRVVIIPESGWHFSSMGSWQDVAAKYAAYAHVDRQEKHALLTAEQFSQNSLLRTSQFPFSSLPLFVQRNADRLPLFKGAVNDSGGRPD